MRKLLGVENAHWFPSLFLCAVGAPAMPQPRFELYEVLGFHAKLAASAPEAASNTFARAS